MTDDLETCPFCGKSWKKEQKPHREYLKLVIQTVVTLVTSTVVVLILKYLGL